MTSDLSGLILLSVSLLLLPFMLSKTIRSFLKIPTIEAQRREAKLIFGRRVIRPEEEVFGELRDYFLATRKLHNQFVLNAIIVVATILIIKVAVWLMLSLPPWSILLSGLLFLFLLGYGTLMIVTMVNSTREIVEDEYEFLMDQIYGQ